MCDPSTLVPAIRTLTQPVCDWLEHAPESPMVRYTRPGLDVDDAIDVRGVLQQSHRHHAIETMRTLLLPRKVRYGLIDYEKGTNHSAGSTSPAPYEPNKAQHPTSPSVTSEQPRPNSSSMDQPDASANYSTAAAPNSNASEPTAGSANGTQSRLRCNASQVPNQERPRS
jgi:hypothetical protein